MRVAVDTNVILSAVLFPKSSIWKTAKYIEENHTMLLSQYVIDEARLVMKRKFIQKEKEFNSYLSEAHYERIRFDISDFSQYPAVRDPKDIPVLAYAIEADADIFLTGDKDFSDIVLAKPKIMTPKEFEELFLPR
jgi:putative PIN family toxin of toxin-antitoxin system